MKRTGIRRRERHRGAPFGERGAADRPGRRERAVTASARAHVTTLVVEVGNRASAWRDAAVDAELSYRWWKLAEQPDRDDAGAVYLAAIDREEKAAAEYNRALEDCCRAVP
jgi:hypothetical protein